MYKRQAQRAANTKQPSVKLRVRRPSARDAPADRAVKTTSATAVSYTHLLAALASYVTGQDTAADPSACGFDDPLVTAEVTTADGTAVLTYAIGTDGYYMRVSGDDSVYTVDGQTVAALCQTAEQLK